MNRLTLLFLLLAYICEYTVFAYYFLNILDLRTGECRFFVISACGYVLMLLTSLIDNPVINAVSFPVINFILILILSDTKWYKAVLHTLVLTSLMLITEGISLVILQNYTYDYYNEAYVFQNRVIFAIISKSLYFIATLILVRLFNKARHVSSDGIRTSVSLYLIPFISVIMMFVGILIWIGRIPEDTKQSTTFFITVIVLLVVVINVLAFSDEYRRIRRTNEYNDLQIQIQREQDKKEYYRQLISESEYRSMLIHDMKNHLLSIRALNQNEGDNAVAHYIDNLLNTQAMAPSIRRSDNEMLNAILSRYAEDCNRNAISFETDIRSKSVDFMTDDEITALFCNLLDNAIESATGSNNPYIDLTAEVKGGTNITVIRLRNSCDTVPDIDTVKDTIKSQKTDPQMHGLGLKSIRNIADRYEGNMHYEYDEEKRAFTMTVMIRRPGGGIINDDQKVETH